MMTTEAHAPGPAAMETLAPRSPYEEVTVFRRLQFAVAQLRAEP